MTRRNLFSLLAAVGLANKADAAAPPAAARPDIVPLRLSDAQWRERLSPQQYTVLRQEGTERPGTSPLNGEKRKGTFVCAGCELPLFLSQHEVRQRHRLAELSHADRRRAGHRAPISSCCCRAPSTTARAAAAIRATSSTTARRPPASATATTAWR